MVRITIPQGILKGGEFKTDSGFEYYGFLGVPYAKPPVGDLRFKNPQPPESWKGERDSTTAYEKNVACQYDIKSNNIIGSEDCLYLNVYTPNLILDDAKLPVMVYIHGGGFSTGNGIIKSETGPDYLIENNVVLVTVNYRLGVFGFLSLDIPEVQGNMGLKDIVKALEWVNKNIGHFNGESNNVTVFGNDSGAASIEYLLLSTKTKELFQKAILQSGSVFNHWSLNREPMKLLDILLKNLNYESDLDNKRQIYEFLMLLSAEEFILASTKAFADVDSKKLNFGFVPIIENYYDNEQSFLTRDPIKMIVEGRFNRIPLIKGFCSKEASSRNLLGNNSVKELSEYKQVIEFIPFDINNQEERHIYILRKMYLDDITLRHANYEKAIDFLSDLDFISGIWISAKILAKFGVSIHVYEFSYVGDLNASQIFKLHVNGAGHGDDCSYLFPNQLSQVGNLNETDIIMMKRMTEFWTNFAKCSNPTQGTSDHPLFWSLFSEESYAYLNISNKLEIKYDYEPKKMAVFQDILKKYF